jgi:hypothetical protein
MEDANYGPIVMNVIYIREPTPLEYIKSFFGLFAPWPEIKEYEVKFINDRTSWFEASTMSPCSEDIGELLNRFRSMALSGFVYNLIGKV